MLPSDRIKENFDYRIKAHDVNPEDRQGYGVGFVDGETSGLATGRIQGNQSGFYKGLAWTIPTAIVSLLIGYGFAKMSSVPPVSSSLYEHRGTTSSNLEVWSAPSEQCNTSGSSNRCCDTTKK